jgi:hypothetical protein
MGKSSEWIEASSVNCFGFCQTHHVDFSPQEDRSGAAGTVGEGKGAATESLTL